MTTEERIRTLFGRRTLEQVECDIEHVVTRRRIAPPLTSAVVRNSAIGASLLLYVFALLANYQAVAAPGVLDGYLTRGILIAAIGACAWSLEPLIVARYGVAIAVGAGAVLFAIAVGIEAEQLSQFALLLTAAVVGVAAVRLLDRPSLLFVVLIAMIIGDLVSFTRGFTEGIIGNVVQGVDAVVTTYSPPFSWERTASSVLISLPSLGGTWLLGVIDVITLSALIGVSRRITSDSVLPTMAMVIVAALPVIAGLTVPLLPFIAGAFAVLHAPVLLRSAAYAWRALVWE